MLLVSSDCFPFEMYMKYLDYIVFHFCEAADFVLVVTYFAYSRWQGLDLLEANLGKGFEPGSRLDLELGWVKL